MMVYSQETVPVTCLNGLAAQVGGLGIERNGLCTAAEDRENQNWQDFRVGFLGVHNSQ